MIKDDLTPVKITDIIFRIDDYLEFMRTQTEDAPELIANLTKYVTDYFKSTEIDELKLKKMAVEMVDEMYVKISKFTSRDIYTDSYFGIVIQQLFFELTKKNIFIFFILDNQLCDDRFKLSVELFGACQFKTIFPYITEKLEYGEGCTKFQNQGYKVIEKEIADTIGLKSHIFYVEKDESVNYLIKVLELAEEFQNEYICVFRNQGPESGSPARWLLGSFNNILKG